MSISLLTASPIEGPDPRLPRIVDELRSNLHRVDRLKTTLHAVVSAADAIPLPDKDQAHMPPDLEALLASQDALNAYLETLADRARGLTRRLDELETLRTAVTVLHEALVGERLTSIRARTAYAEAIAEAGGEGALAVLAPAFGHTGDRARQALETQLLDLLRADGDSKPGPTPSKPRRKPRSKDK